MDVDSLLLHLPLANRVRALAGDGDGIYDTICVRCVLPRAARVGTLSVRYRD